MDSTIEFEYPIYDQSNNEITNPNLNLGYLKKEYFTVHHESTPEIWHYTVVSFEFSDGEIYKPKSENDPHIEIIDNKKGIFNYKELEGESSKTVIGQTITAIQDSPLIPAWDETQTIYRYILYSPQELIQKDFMENGPSLLIETQSTINNLLATIDEAQETIDDLLLIIAELLGGADEESEIIDDNEGDPENTEDPLE